MQTQEFLTELQLVKLLTKNPFYKQLPILVKPVWEGFHNLLPLSGYYINSDKSIDIHGTDKLGISLSKYWDHIVIRDIYGRPRQFLIREIISETKVLYKPRITKDTTVFDTYNTRGNHHNNFLMPVGVLDLQPGDIRPLSEDHESTDIITSTQEEGKKLHIFTLNQFMEPQYETWDISELQLIDNGFDEEWFFSLIPQEI